MGGQAMRKTLAVLVVALGLLGFYATSAAVTMFPAIMTFDREVPTVPAFVSSFGDSFSR